MENKFYPRIEWNDNASLEEKIHAVYNILNSISMDMYAGKVPENKENLEKNIKSTKEELNAPLSISFVTMAEAGDIDDITAAEYADMFLPWTENVLYKIGDMRTYEIETQGLQDDVKVKQLALFKCLQEHTSQADWTPNVSPSLWKSLTITEEGIPEWSQPISTSDAYMTGDEVIYNGIHYRSVIDNNVWAPDAYPAGWEIVE